jgi:hypothetical protein
MRPGAVTLSAPATMSVAAIARAWTTSRSAAAAAKTKIATASRALSWADDFESLNAPDTPRNAQSAVT